MKRFGKTGPTKLEGCVDLFVASAFKLIGCKLIGVCNHRNEG